MNNLNAYKARLSIIGETPYETAVGGLDARIDQAGGPIQQNRMILDKRRSLDRAVKYSYQGAHINHLGVDEDVLALINPNKLKMDYDDKTLSVGYEYNFKVGDILEWKNTGTYWLIYLQDLTELAYFRGDIRKCDYEIAWEEDGQRKRSFVAIRGPIETTIKNKIVHNISIDLPNYTITFMIPKNEDTLKAFKRYSKFYLDGICWEAQAIDTISSPGIIEVAALENYANKFEDDIENGIIGGKIEEVQNPNSDVIEALIIGETFIKPKMEYTYNFSIPTYVADWTVDKKYPVIIEQITPTEIKLKWNTTYSGQFDLTFGEYKKTIIVESLF